MDTGTTIRKLRVDKGYTQQELADQLKISRNAYLAWEKNHVELTMRRLTALCNVYKISFQDFFEYENPKPRDKPPKWAGAELILEKLKLLKEENDKLIAMNAKLIKIIKAVSSKGLTHNLKAADF